MKKHKLSFNENQQCVIALIIILILAGIIENITW
jgi:hypothetical protein